MLVSELIKALKETLNRTGDIPVVVTTDTPDGNFFVDFQPDAAIIQVPTGEDDSIRETVFALAWNGLLGSTETLPEDDLEELEEQSIENKARILH